LSCRHLRALNHQIAGVHQLEDRRRRNAHVGRIEEAPNALEMRTRGLESLRASVHFVCSLFQHDAGRRIRFLGE
jgi:hypothetical protein